MAAAERYIPASLGEYQLQNGSPMIGAGLNLNSHYGLNIRSQDTCGVAISARSFPIGADRLIAWK
jgi:hypothetical protein